MRDEAENAKDEMTSTTVCATITAHNRRSLTVHLLTQLAREAASLPDVELSVVLTDDGSTDGTAESALAAYPRVTVIEGDGNLYWAGGMALAQQEAMRRDPDYVLWLNDDVDLDEGALAAALYVAREADIVVGAMRNDDGSLSYSGLRQAGRRPGSLRLVTPDDRVQPLDTFLGNFVLVSRRAYTALGTIDPTFAHGYGDIDYGYRARAAGLTQVLLPEPIGVCNTNPTTGTWEDPALPLRTRISALVGRKAFPPRSQWRFTRRHGGALAPLWFGSTYAAAVGRILATGRPGGRRA